jgi:anti-sigma factor RsiW
MKFIEPAELSAYLDGELDPARAREVERALAEEPSLRAEFTALTQADAAWRTVARSGEFRPAVWLRYGRPPWASVPAAAAGVALLVAVRILPKLTDTLAWGFLLHGIALAIMVAWVIRLARGGALPADRLWSSGTQSAIGP